jgi:polysaccharide export outer membrane protein
MLGMKGQFGRRLFAAAGGIALAVGVVGCSSTPTYGPAPTFAATPDYRYVIGTGDSVSVMVWRNPELSMGVPVRPDGRLTMPLVEDLMALGRTPTELARDIEKELAKYVRDPMVTVIVTGASGPFSEQIRIIGEAARPQAIPYRQDMTILDVMIVVGGVTDFADGNKTVLVRGAEQGKMYTLRLNDLIKRGDISANVDVKPGDILIIPQSWF